MNGLENDKESSALRCLLVVFSYHHMNTEKVAKAMAGVLEAEVKRPNEVSYEELADYDLIGFGAGIDSDKHYKPLLDFAGGLPQVEGRRCFIFSTSAIQWKDKVDKDHSTLREMVKAKGYSVEGEFSCKGHNTNSFLKLFGGMNKNRPNAEDLKSAEEFALKMKGTMKG